MERRNFRFSPWKKLKGEWSLQRLESDDEKTKWLFRKTNGDAKRIPARREDISVLSGRNMQQIAGDKSAIWNGNQNGSAPVSPSKSVDRKHHLTAPRFVRPMKATAVAQLPEGEEWVYEVKWGGYRVLALLRFSRWTPIGSGRQRNDSNDLWKAPTSPVTGDARTFLLRYS